MLGRYTGIDLNRADAAREQQAGELGDLRVARQQMLAVPVQTGGPDLPLYRSETRESRQRCGDVAHRFEHRRMGRRIQARQPECRADRAKRTVHCSSVDRHQRLIRVPLSSTVKTHVAKRDGSIESSGPIAFQSTSLPELCGPLARVSASRTITPALLIHTPNCSARRSTQPRGAALSGSRPRPRGGGTTTMLPRYTALPSGETIGKPTEIICCRSAALVSRSRHAASASARALLTASARTFGQS